MASTRLYQNEARFFKDLQSYVYENSRDGVRRDVKVKDIYRDDKYDETIYTLVCNGHEWVIHVYGLNYDRTGSIRGYYLYDGDDAFQPILVTAGFTNELMHVLGDNIIANDFVSASRRIRKRSIKASTSSDMYEIFRINKDAYIWQFGEDYTGTPKTGWDNVYDNVVDEFMRYADDEASEFILEKYESGEYTDNDVLDEFDQFLMFRDLNDYDVR